MANTDESMQRWNRLAAELQAYQAELDETWGDLDDATIAKYLAGNATPEEERLVEKEIRAKPAVRELVDVVRDVLSAVPPPPAAASVAAAARCPAWIRKPTNASPFEWRVNPFFVLEDSLHVWLDQAGELMARGLELLAADAGTQPATEWAAVPMNRQLDDSKDKLEVEASNERCWQINLDEAGYLLTLRMRPTAAEDIWEVGVEISSDADPDLADRAEFAISRPDDFPIVKEKIARYANRFVEIVSGNWELTILVDNDIRVLPLAVGSRTDES